MTATAIDWTGVRPALVEVHLPESDGTEAVILGRAPVLSVSASHLWKSPRPIPLDLRCDVVGRDDHTVLVRLGHGITDESGRDTFRVDAGAVRLENPGEAFDRILINHHVDPDNVSDVESAWLAFTEFAQTEIDGVDPAPDSDADGFIIQWGRHAGAASLAFTRQLAMIADGGPALWQVSLEIRFPGFHILPSGDSGWDFTPTGTRRAALAALRATVDEHAPLSSLWYASPAASNLTYGPAD